MMPIETLANTIAEMQKSQRSVLLCLRDTPEAREKEAAFDKLEQLINDPSEDAVKLMAEIAEFIQFGRTYLLTIEDIGAAES